MPDTLAPSLAIEPARWDDAPAIAALNNVFAPDGLTLARTPTFVAERIDAYRVARDADRRVVGCVAVDDYAPSLAELDLARRRVRRAGAWGSARRLVREAERVARLRGYDELFAVSLADGAVPRPRLGGVDDRALSGEAGALPRHLALRARDRPEVLLRAAARMSAVRGAPARFVIPAEAGIQRDRRSRMDSRLRGNDVGSSGDRMIAVVTGSSGFIGSRLVDALAWRGWTVRRLLRAGHEGGDRGAGARATPGAPTPLGTVESHVVDFARPETLADSPALDGADVVFHVAGVTKARSDEEFRAGNVAPTRALLDAVAARGAPAAPRAAPLRARLVAGRRRPRAVADRPLTEDDPPQPFEALRRAASSRRRRSCASIAAACRGRSCGRRRCTARATPTSSRCSARPRTALGVYPGARDARLSIVYVDDLVDALVRAGTAPIAAGQTLLRRGRRRVVARRVPRRVGARRATRCASRSTCPDGRSALAGHAGDAFARITGQHPIVSSQKVTLGRPRWWLCSGERAREELGVVARVSLTDGAKRTLAWYREKGWL